MTPAYLASACSCFARLSTPEHSSHTEEERRRLGLSRDPKQPTHSTKKKERMEIKVKPINSELSPAECDKRWPERGRINLRVAQEWADGHAVQCCLNRPLSRTVAVGLAKNMKLRHLTLISFSDLSDAKTQHWVSNSLVTLALEWSGVGSPVLPQLIMPNLCELQLNMCMAFPLSLQMQLSHLLPCLPRLNTFTVRSWSIKVTAPLLRAFEAHAPNCWSWSVWKRDGAVGSVWFIQARRSKDLSLLLPDATATSFAPRLHGVATLIPS